MTDRTVGAAVPTAETDMGERQDTMTAVDPMAAVDPLPAIDPLTATLTGRRRGHRRRRAGLVAAAAALVLTMWISIAVGSYPIPLPDVLAVLAARLSGDVAPVGVHDAVVWDLRLVRVLLAACVGAALAASGATFQSAFRNPLVEPYILGVSAGAACGAGVAMMIDVPLGVPLLAFCGAVAAVLATYGLSSVRGQRSTVSLILAGIVVGAFFSAAFSFLQYVGTDEQLRRLVFWLLGGFYRATWTDVAWVAPVTLVGVAALCLSGWRLNLLTLGDEECRSLGVDPSRTRRLVITAATVLTAASVCVVGIVAWVGLLVPHCARLIVGPDNRYVVPLSALLGAVFVMICDDVARTAHTGELPIGIITSLLGAPFLAYLLRSRAMGASW